MATGYSPSDIQYASDASIQLQSMSYNHNGVEPKGQDSYQNPDPPYVYENGSYGTDSGPSSATLCTTQSSEDCIVDVTEEEITPPRTGPPKDYLPFSLCVMVVCCFPIGLTAVQSSRECRRAASMRNMAIADAKSEEAKGRACLGVVTGITTWIVLAAFIVLGVLSS